MLKILQARFQEYMSQELPDVQAEGRETRHQIANIHWIIEKSKEFHKKKTKTSTSTLLTTPKILTVWITPNCGKFLNRWEYQTTWPASWEICMQVKKQQLELDMEQQPSSKSGKEYIKAIYNYPANLTSIQSTSCKMPGWIMHKLESIWITLDTQTTSALWQKVKN